MSSDDTKQSASAMTPATPEKTDTSKPAAPAATDPHPHAEVFPYHRLFVLAIDALLILAVGILLVLYFFGKPTAPIMVDPGEGSAPIEQPIDGAIPGGGAPTVPLTIPPTDPIIVPGEEITIVPEPSRCVRTGCSGEICSDREMASTCEFREEYRCYVSARCERQADGACGWTKTPELQSCLLNPLTNQ